ncbi:unnamed protein product [Vitrella brassicaformis CCMP3155]|uniref:P-type domain-containing protein n=1 Tax=Vitrella brassicaformis (strain CCMP3155) TaxID=1169540 RepID=A0A0G4EY28_VITBC|nr:unnamed protein product [Vitrella brassicaformis CCMP3155]|eukprot:CEM04239.1 unnamed protein product [Vitrella brassicaformis CCMP3155]
MSTAAADPAAIVQAGSARFTVLTDDVIRMEDGRWTDEPTFAFINRKLDVPRYHVERNGSTVTITTKALKLEYDQGTKTAFSPSNLRVTMGDVVWTPKPEGVGDANKGNLLGTVRTLDGVDGWLDLDCANQDRYDLHCTYGLLSTQGYTVVDDTNRPRFTAPPEHMQAMGIGWYERPQVDEASDEECAAVKVEERRGCGEDSIVPLDCLGRGCCYDEDPESGPSCWYVPTRSHATRDWYFIGHGSPDGIDYKGTLKAMSKMMGKIPLLPRYAYGGWYSRYWSWSDVELRDIVKEYEERDIPLDVLVIDMNWHPSFEKERAMNASRDQAHQPKGWTGYTWDRTLFPSPSKFLQYIDRRGLSTTLNLHPAGGIEPWEDTYPDVATEMGIDPASGKFVPFKPSDPHNMFAWFNITLAKREVEGVDFWWLDWQQGETWMKQPDVNPTFWLNHLFWSKPHFSKSGMESGTPETRRRPILFGRWGGLGNHRYALGFSGDVNPSWASLKFQVQFTLTAANVLFSYWSHDLGGHLKPCPAEMYTRWIQWGAFSPCMRPHSSKEFGNDRRIWVYPNTYYDIMRTFMRRRAELVPYIYSQGRRAYDDGLALLRPMYYQDPQEDKAYEYGKGQYYFGDDMLVAPVTAPVDNTTGLAEKKIWIPPSSIFYEVGWGIGVKGPAELTWTYDLSEMPVFARVGQVIPTVGGMRADSQCKGPQGSIRTSNVLPSCLGLTFYAGGIMTETDTEGFGGVYEDDGWSQGYEDGAFAYTNVSYSSGVEGYAIIISPPGTAKSPAVLPFLPTERQYEIRVAGTWPPKAVSIGDRLIERADLGERCLADCWTYDGETLTLTVHLVDLRPLTEEMIVAITSLFTPATPLLRRGFPKLVSRAKKVKVLLDNQWGRNTTVYEEDYQSVIALSLQGIKLTYNPATAPQLVQEAIDTLLPNAIKEVQGLTKLPADVKSKALALLDVRPMPHHGDDDAQRKGPADALLTA